MPGAPALLLLNLSFVSRRSLATSLWTRHCLTCSSAASSQSRRALDLCASPFNAAVTPSPESWELRARAVRQTMQGLFLSGSTSLMRLLHMPFAGGTYAYNFENRLAALQQSCSSSRRANTCRLETSIDAGARVSR